MTAFFTLAYNAAATLSRTVESIRNQTCTDWVYYLIDNGSVTDNTREIVRSYAEKDSRIIPICIDENDQRKALRMAFAEILKSGAEYFAILDSDDEYYPDFLEKHLAFIKEENLDMTVSGNDFINSVTNECTSSRKAEQKIILSNSYSYGNYFHTYHRFLRTCWGKLYKTSLFERFDFLNENWDCYKIGYGADTVLAMKMAECSERVGILPESLHKYYISPKSVSYRWDDKRAESDRRLYEIAVDFLMKKAGVLTRDNKDFLDRVYINALYDTIAVVFNAETTLAKKLSVLRDIFSSQHTLNTLSNERIDPARRLGLARKTLLTLIDFREMSTTEDGLWLGINLSAMVGNQEDYIKYSISNIAFLIKNKRFAEAENELSEWEALLPDNEQLKILRNKLKNH